MSILSDLFSTQRGRTKRNVLRAFNGTLVKVPAGHTVVLSSPRGWATVLDVDSPEGQPMPFFGPRPATRIAVPVRRLDGFTFEIRRRGLVGDALFDRRKKWRPDQAEAREQAFQAEIQHRLTPPALEFGHGEFDYEFTVETNDEPQVRRLLDSADLRGAFQAQRSVNLKLAHEDEWFESLWPDVPPAETAVLYHQSSRVLTDLDQIRNLHYLLAQTAEHLVDIGSASSGSVPLPQVS